MEMIKSLMVELILTELGVFESCVHTSNVNFINPSGVPSGKFRATALKTASTFESKSVHETVK